jgi:hypothetical protein
MSEFIESSRSFLVRVELDCSSDHPFDYISDFDSITVRDTLEYNDIENEVDTKMHDGDYAILGIEEKVGSRPEGFPLYRYGTMQIGQGLIHRK